MHSEAAIHCKNTGGYKPPILVDNCYLVLPTDFGGNNPPHGSGGFSPPLVVVYGHQKGGLMPV